MSENCFIVYSEDADAQDDNHQLHLLRKNSFHSFNVALMINVLSIISIFKLADLFDVKEFDQ